jgi:hypothetical protein
VGGEVSPVVIHDSHSSNSSLPLLTDQNVVQYHHIAATCLIGTGKELFPKVLQLILYEIRC